MEEDTVKISRKSVQPFNRLKSSNILTYKQTHTLIFIYKINQILYEIKLIKIE